MDCPYIMYSHGPLLSNGYKISPMKMSSHQESKIYPLELLTYFKKGFRSFQTVNLGSVGQTAAKLLAFKLGGLKKVCHPTPAPLEPVSQGSNPGEVESFSKFHGR